MKVEQFLKEAKEGKRDVLLFTQEHCDHCKKMKETLIELGIPAYEVPVDLQMVEAHDLTVTPTLITYTNDELGRVHGRRSAKDLKEWIGKL